MNSLLVRAFLVFVATLVTWACAPLALADATPSPAASTVLVYTYDGQHSSAGPTLADPDRGPPSDDRASTSSSVGGLGPMDASAHQNAAVTLATYDYADLAPCVRAASRGGAAGQASRTAACPVDVERLGVAANAGDDLTRVGRWMGDDELLKMQKSGQVQVGGGGTTHVADPANMATYARQAAPGSTYVEFDVPRTSLFPSGWPGGAQIPGPNHILARLAERRGSPVQFPVPACNIVVVGSC